MRLSVLEARCNCLHTIRIAQFPCVAKSQVESNQGDFSFEVELNQRDSEREIAVTLRRAIMIYI